MLHDFLKHQGVRDDCEITFVMALPSPVPPSPEASKALLEAFAERDIEFIGGTRVKGVAADKVLLDNGTELAYDLFLGVPKHRAPDVIQESGMAQDGYIPVNPANLETKFAGVYAVGDCATAGVPKAGVFAEGAAKVVASALITAAENEGEPIEHKGQGSCYIEFGDGLVGRVDIDFLSGPEKTGRLQAPSVKFAAEKDVFGTSRRARWFDSQ
jgi:sulfide:quinone oxidoreductase